MFRVKKSPVTKRVGGKEIGHPIVQEGETIGKGLRECVSKDAQSADSVNQKREEVIFSEIPIKGLQRGRVLYTPGKGAANRG